MRWALVFVAAMSCRAKPPAVVDVATADAAPSIEASAESVPPDASVPDAGVARKPAPGMWNASIVERAGTCADAGLVASNTPVFVQIRPFNDGTQGANVPLSTSGSISSERMDLVLEAGKIIKMTMERDKSCRFEVKRELEVARVSGDEILLVVRSDYGDASGCAGAHRFSSCKREIAITYTLVRAFCEPHCAAEAKFLPDGGVTDVQCKCVDVAPRP